MGTVALGQRSRQNRFYGGLLGAVHQEAAGRRVQGMPGSGCSVPNDEAKRHARRVVRGLARAYPDADCALVYQNGFELLAATILSAQCTDERVNMVTPKLFARYSSAAELAASRQRDVERIIRSTGFFRNKATSLRGMARAVVERFDGEIPRSLDELVTLPGVGRKTANVVLGTCYGVASGVVVDTHVKRISWLLGLTEQTHPDKIEQVLNALLPRKQWISFSHRVIHHGRRICIARRPNCLECPLLKCCPRVGLPPLDQ